MTGFAVTAASLRATADLLAELAREADTRIATLHAELAELTSSGWRGPAADGFRAGGEEWNAGAVRICAQLAEMAQLLNTTAAHYGENENATADLARGLV